jgi:mono/diheme cytochrome c family protein
MSRPTRTARAALGFLVLALVAVPAPLVRAQEQPPHPFAPTWANLAGATVFSQKGCGLCHAIRGYGATAGPDLSQIERKSFFDLGAAMSNHLRGVNIRKPTLSPEETTSLIAFLFTLQYYDPGGDRTAGEQLFTAKGCALCHEVGGKGGHRGPGLDFLKRGYSPVLVAAALWNHGPEMAEAIEAQGIKRPTFEGKELADLIAYIVSAAKDGGGELVQVAPGTPERGAKLFASKQCVTCHSVGGKGGKVGPELGRRQHVSLTQFTALMWNHGPKMWAKMQERGIQVPRLKPQEMADIVAYLYVSHYFDEVVDPGRGQQVLDSKGCLSCHTARGKGTKVGTDLATYPAARSSAALVASLWNHPRWLEARRQEVPSPLFTGQELADVAAYLATLPKASTAKPKSS